MAEPSPACAAPHAADLSAEVKHLLTTQLPQATSAEFDRGILTGLEFALRLRQAVLSPEQGRAAVAAAVAAKKIQVEARNQAELPAIYARLRAEFTAADLAEYANLDEEGMIPSEQLLAELEDIVRQEDRNGAAS